MRTVLFTKLFESRPVEEVGRVGAELGFDGIDLLIRSGFTVDPKAAAEELPRAVRALADAGLSVPMATTDLTEPNAEASEVLSACADAGIELVRLGYWKYDAQRPYADVLAQARSELIGMAEIAKSLGIKVAIQLHGGTVHASGALTKALLDGCDPDVVGVYPDPGNQAVQSGREDWRLTFDVCQPWLVCVGVKNGGWFPDRVETTGQRAWRSDWLGLADGMVPWPAILAHLADTGYSGLLSFHSHYEMPYEQVLDQTRLDLRHVRRLLAGLDR